MYFMYSRVHVDENMQNAFWDSEYISFGDGGEQLYPMVSLDITAHEICHGFTEQHSGLIYAGQSGNNLYI